MLLPDQRPEDYDDRYRQHVLFHTFRISGFGFLGFGVGVWCLVFEVWGLVFGVWGLEVEI